MAIETETFNMCNYSTSRIVVGLRDRALVVEPGRRDKPSYYPFTMNELQQIANTSTIIQNGYLRPNKEQEEFIYNTLRIQNWQDILTDEQIEDMILRPTVEGLTRLINIKDSLYFGRIYGVFVGLKNANAPISANVSRLLTGRYREMRQGKFITEYKVTEKDLPSADSFLSRKSESSAELEELKRKFQEQEALVATLMAELKSKNDEAKAAPKSVKRKPTTTKKPVEG